MKRQRSVRVILRLCVAPRNHQKSRSRLRRSHSGDFYLSRGMRLPPGIHSDATRRTYTPHPNVSSVVNFCPRSFLSNKFRPFISKTGALSRALASSKDLASLGRILHLGLVHPRAIQSHGQLSRRSGTAAWLSGHRTEPRRLSRYHLARVDSRARRAGLQNVDLGSAHRPSRVCHQ